VSVQLTEPAPRPFWWDDTVERTIEMMRGSLGDPHELSDIARTACMSPFHFHRVFSAVTAATPKRFLTALRMAEAKRLLLDTELSATDISFTVGYASFSTFTTQFTKLVGVPPGRFRTCVQPVADMPVGPLMEHLISPGGGRGRHTAVRGRIGRRPDGETGIVVVGLFPAGIPQGLPSGCVVTTPLGRFEVPAGPGTHTILALSVAPDATVRDVLLARPAARLAIGSVEIPGAAAPRPEALVPLRPPRITDPPILIAFPLLAASDLASGRHRRAHPKG
jgi:AraC-like DNA-binding protein